MSTSEADKAIEAAYKASMTNLRHGGELDISDKYTPEEQEALKKRSYE